MLDQNFVLPKTVDQDRESGVFYSYDYNNAHFIVLNTNNLSEDKALSDDQLAWLKADAQASDAQWKIVVLHKALYSNGSHYDDKDVKAMRKQLCGLCPTSASISSSRVTIMSICAPMSWTTIKLSRLRSRR